MACSLPSVIPASAQQSSLEKGSKVKPLGSPISLFTRILLFSPSKEDVSILGASRFQSVQYKLLWDKLNIVKMQSKKCVSEFWLLSPFNEDKPRISTLGFSNALLKETGLIPG